MRKLWIEFDRVLNEGETDTVLSELAEMFGESDNHGYDERDGVHRFSAPYPDMPSLVEVRAAIDSAETGLEIVDIYLGGMA